MEEVGGRRGRRGSGVEEVEEGGEGREGVVVEDNEEGGRGKGTEERRRIQKGEERYKWRREGMEEDDDKEDGREGR